MAPAVSVEQEERLPLEAVWDWGSVEGQTIKSEASLCLMDNSQLCLEYAHDA